MAHFLGQPTRMVAKVAHFVSYLVAFGFVRGFRARLVMLIGSGEVIVSIPQSRTGIVIRPNTSDPIVFEQVFLERAYELPVKLQPSFIIDGGANAGYTSLFFANTYPTAQIAAVEPDDSNFCVLERNVADYSNVSVVSAAIWSEATTLALANPDAEKWEVQVRVAERESNGTIRAVTIDQLMREHEAERVSIMKLDIEGSEKEVFSRPGDWLDRVDVAIVELHDHIDPGCSTSFYTAIAGRGFDVFTRGEHVFLVAARLQRL